MTIVGMFMVRRPLFTAHRFLALLAATAPIALVATVSAAQSVWTGAGDNAFENDANWTPRAPAATDRATVDTGSPQVSTGERIDRLDVGGGNVTVTDTGALTVTNGTTMTSGSITINSGGLLTSDVDLTGGSLAIDGTLDGRLSLQNGSVTVNGTLRDAVIESGTSLSNNGTMTGASVEAGGTFTNNGGATLSTLDNAGTASNAGRIGTMQNTDGNFTNNAGGEVLGKTTVSGGSVTNNFVVTDVDVAAAAAFTNNNGATAGNVRNSGTVVNAGTVASLQNDAGSFTNDVDGRITGRTTISGGTVTNNFVVTDVDVAAAAAFANNTGATADNVRNSGNFTNAGTISSLRNDAGTTTNNAGGRVTGTTTVAGGTVTNNFVVTDVDVAAAAAFVNNTGASASAITNRGAATNNGTVASIDNQAGLFTNNTGGVVTGTTTVSGGTVVNNDTLGNVQNRVGGSFINNLGATTDAVVNEGTATNDGTVASLTNTSGRFTNTGTITGEAAITGGEVRNDGTITGTVDIFDGGLLSGVGVSGGLVVGAGGVLAPGPGIATMTISGDATFRRGAVYDVDIDSTGRSDRLDVSGTARLEGGVVDLRAASGTYGLSTRYEILTAGVVDGTFDGVTSDFAFLSPTLIYGTTFVDLQLDRNAVRFADVARTSNDRAAAGAIEAAGSSNPLFQAVLPLNIQTAQSAFAQLNGEIHPSLKSALISDNTLLREAILDKTNRVTSEGEVAGGSIWATGLVSKETFAGNAMAGGLEISRAGTLVGGDLPIVDDWRLGGVLGYSTLDAAAGAEVQAYHFGLYTHAELEPFSFTGGAIYTRNEITTRRNVAFGTFSDVLTADYTRATSQVFADLGWRFELDNLRLQPFAGLAYTAVDGGAIREDGGAAALAIEDKSFDTTISTLGLRFSTDLEMGEVPILLSGMIGWCHNFGETASFAVARFDGGSPFMLEGIAAPQDTMVVKAGVTVHLSKSARLMVSYSGDFAEGFSSNAALANLTVNF
ncbi:autotransporter domain-containing protein [Agrobacterium sp. SORGH_AS 787]|uniref:autotransporter outer membrane beta-barrel domain-containing protein n=1 Tax=Agrobacterium sp. SORGH_AS 787 TaxID=3041775 RepID=UPI00278A35DC|nr:subtilase-type serine protease [Rhizobium sp. SORGH_AS_0787]